VTPPSDRDGPSRRLLIVEDDADISSSLALLLAHPSIRIEAARDGVEAIAKARDFRPHAVLLDILLPGMDGFEVFRILKKELDQRSTRVLLLSAHAGPAALALAKDAGAYDCIAKPFDGEDLRARVLRAIHLPAEAPPAAGARPAERGEAVPLGGASGAPRAAARAAPGGVAGRAPYVAVIDDDLSLAGAIKVIVREALSEDVAVTQHRFGMTAIADFGETPPDLVLLDLNLPDVDGLTVLKRLKRDARLADAPVIVITAHAPGHVTSAALAAGADAVVPKPFETAALMDAIRRAHERRRAAVGPQDGGTSARQ